MTDIQAIDEAAPAGPAAGALADPLGWLERVEHAGTRAAEALAMFDALPPVPLEAMRGAWRGSGVATGHRLDGLLEAYGWAGKAFDDDGDAYPLLFARGREGGGSGGGLGETVAIDPRWLPVRSLGGTALAHSRPAAWAFRLARPLLATREPQARLRLVAHRGVTTAGMIYDRQPIVDLFRQLAPGVVLGLMDMRGEAPFFFALRKVGEDGR